MVVGLGVCEVDGFWRLGTASTEGLDGEHDRKCTLMGRMEGVAGLTADALASRSWTRALFDMDAMVEGDGISVFRCSRPPRSSGGLSCRP